MANPADIAAATEMVDYALDYVRASPAYRALHREKAIRNGFPFARFERRQRELDAAKAIVAIARAADSLPVKHERKAA